MTELRKTLEEHMRTEKEIDQLAQKKRDLEYNIIQICVDAQVYDAFKINWPKLRRMENLPPHYKHI